MDAGDSDLLSDEGGVHVKMRVCQVNFHEFPSPTPPPPLSRMPATRYQEDPFTTCTVLILLLCSSFARSKWIILFGSKGSFIMKQRDPVDK